MNHLIIGGCTRRDVSKQHRTHYWKLALVHQWISGFLGLLWVDSESCSWRCITQETKESIFLCRFWYFKIGLCAREKCPKDHRLFCCCSGPWAWCRTLKLGHLAWWSTWDSFGWDWRTRYCLWNSWLCAWRVLLFYRHVSYICLKSRSLSAWLGHSPKALCSRVSDRCELGQLNARASESRPVQS